MGNNVLVSVIMIFLNEEKFIEEAIESVFAQTYDNWELLLVDDGSSDRSTKIAAEYAEQHPKKVRYLEHVGHQNRGMSASRNLGIRHAQGGYIGLLDADDVWLPNILERQIAIFALHPEAAMVYGRSQRWYSWTGNPEDHQRDSIREVRVQADSVVKPPKVLTAFLQDEGAKPSGILIRRDVVQDVGGFDETFPGMYEDQVFLAKVCLRTPVFVSSESWYRHRKHENSTCSLVVRSGQYHSSRLAFLTWAKVYITKQGVKDDDLWKVLRTELRPYDHPILHCLLRNAKRVLEQLRWLVGRIARRIVPIPVRSRLRTW